MDNIKATANFLLDTRKEKKDSVYPIKLTIYFDGKKKRYTTGINLSEDNWIKLHTPNLRDDQLKIVKRKLNNLKEKSDSIFESLLPFSFTEFEAMFFDEKRIRKSSFLNDLFDDYINLLNKEERIGSAISYRTTLNSIEGFKKGLRITDISKEFLHEYERHLSSKNLSSATIGIYFRQLRRIVNVAIKDGLLPIQKYPFKGYQIPVSRNIKKALTNNQVKLLLAYHTESRDLRKALDFWLFSYISNGINMTDICLLKPENLDKEFFYFHRAKTKNTRKKDLRPIKVPLTDLSKRTIEKWRNKNPDNPYLFNVLEAGLNARQIKFKIQDFISYINKNMRTIGDELGIDVKLGTYVARHTHATILKRSGAPTELIKENLGHSSVLTTENYLDDFTDDYKKDFARYLTEL